MDGNDNTSSLCEVRKALMQLRGKLTDSQEERLDVTYATELENVKHRLEILEAALLALPAEELELSPQSIEVIRLHSRIDQLESLCSATISCADVLKAQFEDQMAALREEIATGFASVHFNYDARDVVHRVAPPSKYCEELMFSSSSRYSDSDSDTLFSALQDTNGSIHPVTFAKSQLSQDMNRLHQKLSEDFSDKFLEAHSLMKANFDDKIAKVLELLQESRCEETRLPSMTSTADSADLVERSFLDGSVTPEKKITSIEEASCGHATATDVASEVMARTPRSSPLQSVSARHARVKPASLACLRLPSGLGDSNPPSPTRVSLQ